MLIQQQCMETWVFCTDPSIVPLILRISNITNISCSLSTCTRTKDAGTVWVCTIFRPYLNPYALLCHVHVAEGVGLGGGGVGRVHTCYVISMETNWVWDCHEVTQPHFWGTLKRKELWPSYAQTSNLYFCVLPNYSNLCAHNYCHEVAMCGWQYVKIQLLTI